jgi:hypothetical protein
MYDERQKYLRELISKIKRLTSKEKYHILSIFKKYDVEFTKNSNGYFFNLDKIDEVVLDKVYKCAELIEEKRDLITTLDQKRDSYLEYYKNLIENKLKETINKRRENYINQLVLLPEETFFKKKIKKRVRVVLTDVDPDVLMKEHSKTKKYNKNSVYFRINQIISSRKFKNNRDKGKDNESGYDEDSSGRMFGEDDVGEDIGISGESGEMEGLGDELAESIGEEYLDEDGSNEDNTSDIKEYDNESEDVDDDEYYKDSNSEDTSTEHKTEKTERTEKTEKTDNKTKTTKTKTKKKKKAVEASSQEVDYYKNLLKQSGFKFDDDKGVQIKMEDYID